MRLALGFTAVLFLTTAVAAQNISGSWNGTYTYSIQITSCQNKTFTSMGSMTAVFLQSGTAITGRFDLSDVMTFGSTCTPTLAHSTGTIIGNVNGSTIAFEFTNDSGATQFVGTISGNTMSLTLSDQFNGTGTASLARSTTPASVEVTGTWSGTYNLTDRCSNGVTVPYSDQLTLALTQSGTNATGVVTMPGVPLYDFNCHKLATETVMLSVAGSVAGNTFNGAVYEPSGSFDFPISVTIANTAMSGTVAGASLTSTTGTFSLNRNDVLTPASNFGGSYSGTYDETDNEVFSCLNISTLHSTGPVTLTINHAGNAISGVMIQEGTVDVASDNFGNCFVIGSGERVLPIWGTLTGNTMTLTMPIGGGVTNVYNFLFGSSSLTGKVTDSFGDVLNITANKTLSAPPPRRRAATH